MLVAIKAVARQGLRPRIVMEEPQTDISNPDRYDGCPSRVFLLLIQCSLRLRSRVPKRPELRPSREALAEAGS
jgi:hypothetical protein